MKSTFSIFSFQICSFTHLLYIIILPVYAGMSVYVTSVGLS